MDFYGIAYFKYSSKESVWLIFFKRKDARILVFLIVSYVRHAEKKNLNFIIMDNLTTSDDRCWPILYLKL